MSSGSEPLLLLSTVLNRLQSVETPLSPADPANSFVNTKVGDGIFHQDTPSRYRQHSAYSSVRL
jgi:hypothetical protein